MAQALEHLRGKYEILEKLQEGGMGAVYKVRHRLLDEVRVIKVVRPQFKADEEIKARFLREARTVIRLRHPNIAQLYDFSLDAEENAFIVMEFIDGVTFQELLRRSGELPLPLVLEMARQSLEALRYLHRRGIVHRDVAPDNLMLTRDEEGAPLVKLIDLGVAKVLEGGSHFTVAGTFLGKVRYASPEQFRAQEGVQVEPRSDLYSFGVVLYQLLTGVLPVRGTSISALIAGHLLEPPVPFAESDPAGRVPEDLRRLVLQALAKRPEDRPASAAAFAEALAAIQERYPLLPGVLDEALSPQDIPTTRLPVVSAGSTQDRLDRQFQLEATAQPRERPPWVDPPLHASTGAPLPSPPPHLQPAGGEEAPAATPAPAGPAAEPAAALPPAPASTPWLKDLVREVEGLLDGGHASAARRTLERAEAEVGARPALAQLKERVAQGERQRRQQSASLLVEARVAVGMEDWEAARRHLQEALRLDPKNAEASRLLAHLSRQQAARRPHAAAAGGPSPGVAPPAGERAPRGAQGTLPPPLSPPAAPPPASGPAAAAQAEELQRRERVAELLRQARAAAEAQRHREAESLLERALELSPEDTLVAGVLAATRREREELERQRQREVALASVVRRVEELLRRQAPEEALAALEEAAAQLGQVPQLAQLRRRAGERAAEAAAWRAARAAAAEAATLLREGLGLQALARLEDARAAAGFAEVLAFLGEEERRVREQMESDRRGRELAEASRRLETLLAGGHLEEAARALALAERLFPGQEQLLGLRRRLEREQERQRAATLAALTRRARELAAAGRFELALQEVAAAQRQYPQLREPLETLLDDLRREEAAFTVSSCLARGDVAEALRALDLAERKFPGDNRLTALRRQLSPSS